jgi:beta-lactamase regulating signal transducer with metallopeptidase domain
MMIPEILPVAVLVETVASAAFVGALVAAAVAITLRVYPPASAAARYRVWSATLAAIALVPIAIAFARTPTDATTPVARPASVTKGPALAGSAVDESLFGAPAGAPPAPLDVRVPRDFPLESIAFAILAILAAATAFRLGRIARGALWCARVRRRSVPIPDDVEARFAGWLRVREQDRRARVVVSPDASQPMAIGFFAPVIVLPHALLDRLSDEDLDNLVLHEIAHIRRGDDWALLAQRLLEALYTFNPVVAWVARRLETERELACDEWAVTVTHAPTVYAKSLLRLAELRLSPTRAALAPGALQGSHLARRVESLLRFGSGARRRPAAVLATVVAVATFSASAWLAPSIRVSKAAPIDESKAAVATASVAPRELKPLDATSLRADAVAAIAADDASRDDATARRAALSALGERAGTVVVMDPRTGRVLTIVNQEWALRRSFAAASTAKLVTTIAALRTNSFDPAALVPAQNLEKKIDLDAALAYSDTRYFEAVGEKTGTAALVENARLVGFGEATDIDLPGEIAGHVPDAATAEPRALGGWGSGIEMTPVQLAAFVSAIANGGHLLRPHLDADSSPVVRRDLTELQPTFARLMPGMLGAARYGTASPAFDQSFPIAGKTGTYVADGYSVGIFASFEATSPRYTVVVLIAGKNVVGATAAGVAARVYKGLDR